MLKVHVYGLDLLLRHARNSRHIILSIAIADDNSGGNLCSWGTWAVLMDIKYSKADYESMTAFLNFFFDYTFVPLP
jgi:hypothetical protein